MVATQLHLARLIDDLLDRTRMGMSLPLLVTGEHGAGKTEQLRRVRLQARDMIVVEGAAAFSDAQVPYAALRSMTRSVELAARRVVDSSVFRSSLTSGLASRGRSTSRHGEIVAALELLFTELGEMGPVVLTFDDLHHADRASCDAVIHLVRHLRGGSVFVAVASAGEPLLDARAAATFERYRRAADLEVAVLDRLDESVVRTMIETGLGARPDRALVEHVMAMSDGIPLFVVESIAALGRSAALTRSNGSVGMGADHPLSAGDCSRVVVEGVLALGDDAHRLAVVAAAGAPVTLDHVAVLAELAGLTGGRADKAFDDLVAGGVLVSSGAKFSFAVPLVQAALRAELGPARRARLRSLTGGTFDHETPSLIDLIIAEGDTTSASEPQSAVEMYRRALELQDRAQVIDTPLRLKLGHALLFAARHREAAEIAAELLGSTDLEIRVDACELAVEALRSANRHDEGAQILDRALRDPTVCSARLLLDRAELSFWCDELRVARRHLAAARAAGLDELEPVAAALELELDLAGAPSTTEPPPAERDHGWADAAPRIQPRLARMVFAAGIVHDHHAARSSNIGDGVVPPDVQAAYQAWLAYRVGSWAEAERLAHDALSPSELYGEAPNITAVGVMAALLAERGAFSRADGVLALSDTARYERLIVDWARALLALHRGEDAAALRLCVDAVAHLRRIGRGADATLYLPLEAQAALRRRDTAHALATEKQLLELDHEVMSPVARVQTLVTTARVHGEGDCAAEAVRLAEQHGLALEAASALGVQGIVRSDPSLLSDAHRALGELGAVARQREITRHLRRLGRRVPSRRAGGVNQLTSTESEIASLVGLGLTNRQISQQTELSIKTVETYLSRVFAKTGSRSRTELAIYVNARESNP